MSLLIFMLEKRAVVDGREHVIRSAERWFVKDAKKDFHCKYAVIKKEQLKPGKVTVANFEFFIVPSQFVDRYIGMRRGAQIITRKDLGFIIGYTGLNKESVVLESGAGSGASAIMLAKICKKVYSIEIEPENIALVKENLAGFGVKNVVLREGNIYEPKSVTVKNVDLVLLDVPEPWQAMKSCDKALALGGFIVVYTPTIMQAARFMDRLPANYIWERTVEVLDRDWKIKGEAVRPISSDIGHTAFLTFVRRIA